MKIHPTAVVHPNAKLDQGVEIGPYSIIGENVKIGKNTIVGPHVVIDGWTEIGEENKIFQFASIGMVSQDLKYKGEVAYLKIGNKNTIREYVTMHIGTEGGGGLTKIGDNNLFMVGAHIAHDCIVGNGNILANLATLAGHIIIEDNAIVGGVVAIHQFCRIGQMAIIGGCSKIVQDVPPYMMADGNPLEIRGINLVGLKRRNITAEAIHNLKEAYRIIYRSNLNTSQAMEKLKNEFPESPEIKQIVTFVEGSSRGITK